MFGSADSRHRSLYMDLPLYEPLCAAPRELIRRQHYVERYARAVDNPAIIIYDFAQHRVTGRGWICRRCAAGSQPMCARRPRVRFFVDIAVVGSLANNACKRQFALSSDISYIVMSAYKYAPPSATIHSFLSEDSRSRADRDTTPDTTSASDFPRRESAARVSSRG